MISRRSCLIGLGAGLTTAYGSQALAADKPTPIVAYMDGIQPGWWIGGWTKNTPQFAFADGQKPVEITMAAWNAFTFQTSAAIDTSAFTALTMLVHGGDKGKQAFEVSFKKGDKVVSEALVVKCDKGQWVRTDLPLKRAKIKEPIDTILFNNRSPDGMPPFYVNVVLFQ